MKSRFLILFLVVSIVVAVASNPSRASLIPRLENKVVSIYRVSNPASYNRRTNFDPFTVSLGETRYYLWDVQADCTGITAESLRLNKGESDYFDTITRPDSRTLIFSNGVIQRGEYLGITFASVPLAVSYDVKGFSPLTSSSVTFTPVPEPATLLLLGLGGLILRRKRRA